MKVVVYHDSTITRMPEERPHKRSERMYCVIGVKVEFGAITRK